LSSSDSDFQFYLFLLLAIKQWETVAGRATFLGHFWAEIKAENVAISFAFVHTKSLAKARSVLRDRSKAKQIRNFFRKKSLQMPK
jgi:hypothetical protein